MEEIADQLLKNAREGKVEWVNSPHRDAYQVKVPDGSLVIMRLDSQAYRLDLNDDQGNSLESLASYDSTSKLDIERDTRPGSPPRS